MMEEIGLGNEKDRSDLQRCCDGMKKVSNFAKEVVVSYDASNYNHTNRREPTG